MPDSEDNNLARRLALYLEPSGDEPLYRQLVNRIWLEVVTGTLETGARLPTVRQLAIDLSTHPNIVARAYQELEVLGVLKRKPGEGTFVSLTQPDRSEMERRSQLERLCRDLTAQGEALGLTLDDVMEALADLRAARRDAKTKSEGR